MAMYTPAVGDNQTQVQYKCEKPKDPNYKMILYKKTWWSEIEIDGNVHVGKWR